MSVKYDFKGRRVLVTGGAKGLGKAVVDKFLEAGAHVIILDRDQERLLKVKEEHPSVELIVADLLDWNDSRAKVLAAAPIDHLVNNAGIAEIATFQNISPESIDRIFGINFKAAVNMGQAVAEGLTKSGKSKGTIVNVSSIMSNRSFPSGGMYCCTKAAVSMLTKVMATELEPQGIRVTEVRPTLMITELIPQTTEENISATQDLVKFCLDKQLTKRLLTVEETAESILFLSSDSTAMVNGSDILIDGGMYST